MDFENFHPLKVKKNKTYIATRFTCYTTKLSSSDTVIKSAFVGLILQEKLGMKRQSGSELQRWDTEWW